MTADFRDRRHAGRMLALRLAAYADRHDVMVLALPGGGVPVAFEVASALHAPLEVFIVRKLAVPGHAEYAMGALASGGVRVLNPNVVNMLDVASADIEAVTRAEMSELRRREQLYRDGQPLPAVRDLALVLVDDGVATGSTLTAAVKALRTQQPARIVVAMPTTTAQTCEALRTEADDVVCATAPQPFRAVCYWYEDYSQTSDGEVVELLARARGGHPHNTHEKRP